MGFEADKQIETNAARSRFRKGSPKGCFAKGEGESNIKNSRGVTILNALKFVKVKQVAVAGDDVFAGSLNGSGKDVIVFRIVRNSIQDKCAGATSASVTQSVEMLADQYRFGKVVLLEDMSVGGKTSASSASVSGRNG